MGVGRPTCIYQAWAFSSIYLMDTKKRNPKMDRQKIPLPEYIEAFGVRYRVTLNSELSKLDVPLVGDTDGNLRQIRICSHQDSRRKWTTLLHEYMHAILYVNGMSSALAESNEEFEEIIVQSFEHAIESFMLKHGEDFLKALEAQKET